MCGIAGLFSLDRGMSLDVPLVERMLDTMPYRGPDASGVQIIPAGGLGHRRLSILDLRPESNQPFALEDDSLSITYNGEIFNYIEIREELESLGHCFRTTSDTEVVLRAYRQWGRDAVKRFNGMWAFAIYDRDQDALFCSRDRFGIKPFYYAVDRTTGGGGRFIFASEIKAMLAASPSLAEPDFDSLSLMLRSQITCERDDTFFAEIKRLPPAQNLWVDRDGLRFNTYWEYPTEGDGPSDADAAAEQLAEILSDALRIRMRSDVPVGNTLSGGVDSSALACMLREFYQQPHETFTASYPGMPFDEAPIAAQLSQDLGMNSNLVPATTTEFIDTLKRCVFHMDSPVHTPAVLPLWNIMEAMRKKVVVAIEGQGADELFGGYATQVFPSAFADRLAGGHLVDGARELLAHRSHWGSGQTAAWSARRSIPGSHAILRRIRGDEAVYAGPLANGPANWTPETPPPKFKDRVTQLLYSQHTGGLRALLHYGDSISMAHSIESRLPFMDYRLVEFGFRLPGHLKFRNAHGKAVLKDAVRPFVPARIVDTRGKLGFVTPISKWFRDQAGEIVHPVLRDERCRARGLFDSKQIDRALDQHASGRFDVSNHIFRWISTELWFQEFIDA